MARTATRGQKPAQIDDRLHWLRAVTQSVRRLFDRDRQLFHGGEATGRSGFLGRLMWNSWSRAAAVLAGALLLCWPAVYNGFPLLYPDSMTYVGDGPNVARAVFLHSLSEYYGVRSFFYSLGILPFNWNVTPWPVVALKSMLVAWVVWLVVRSIAPRHTVSRYLVIVVLLAALTSASWYASFIMPDILGPILYLAIYLLVFGRDTLSRMERLSLYPLAWWAATAHATHLVLAAGLCVLLAIFVALERKSFRIRIRAVGEVAAVIVLAATAQMALHGYLYGKPSLNGEPRPYLMARVIADGPGRLYLEKNCGHLQWTICRHLGQLSDDVDAFLWVDNGVFEGSSDEEKKSIGKEEMPLVLATLRIYPREQFLKSAANFQEQLMSFGSYGFDHNQWLLDQFSQVLTPSRSSYLRSREARDGLPLDLISDVQFWTVAASLAAIAVLIPLLWRRHSPRVAGLGLVILSMVVFNSLLTGVVAVVDDRYGCRVIWLVPLLARLLALDWLHQRQMAKQEARSRTAEEQVAVLA